jgi:hypothetical protein
MRPIIESAENRNPSRNGLFERVRQAAAERSVQGVKTLVAGRAIDVRFATRAAVQHGKHLWCSKALLLALK